MVSKSEFKNNERELDRVYKDLDKFDENFNKTTDEILNASFDKRNYGSSEIDRKLNKMVDDAKRNINHSFEAFNKEIDRYIYDSKERIKAKCRDSEFTISSYNHNINEVVSLNNLYSSKDYNKTIEKAMNMIENENDAISKYAVLVMIDSEDKLCSSLINNYNDSMFDKIKRYNDDCQKYNAKNHLKNAKAYYFLALFHRIENNNEINNAELYRYSVETLECYNALDSDVQHKFIEQKNVIYDKAIAIYNELCSEAYNNFMYLEVKKLLNDRKLFNKGDIAIEFFTNDDIDENVLFEYLKEYGSTGSQDSISMIFEDTFDLAKNDKCKEYLDYWIKTYDNNGWIYSKRVINEQKNKYEFIEVVFSAVIKNSASVSKTNNLIHDSLKTYLDFLNENSKSIDIDGFSDSCIASNNYIKWIVEKKISDNNVSSAISSIDNINFAMIKKYFKKYCLYHDEKINKLNVVLKDSSNRLFSKEYKKVLQKDTKETTKNKLNISVKLCTNVTLDKNKKILVIIGIASAVLLIGLIILFIVLFK